MSGLSYNQAMWSTGGNTRNGPTRRRRARKTSFRGMGDISAGAEWRKPGKFAEQSEALGIEKRVAASRLEIKKAASYVSALAGKMRAQAFDLENKSGDNFSYLSIVQQLQENVRTITEMADDLNRLGPAAAASWEAATTAAPPTWFWWLPNIQEWRKSNSEISKMVNTAKDYVRRGNQIEDELKFSLMRADREQKKAAAEAQAIASKQAAADAAKKAEIATALAASQAREDQFAQERAIATAAATAQATAQAQAQTAAATAKYDAESAERVAKQTIELARIEAELEIERTRLQYDLDRLRREEERAIARDERELEREQQQYQLELARSGLTTTGGPTGSTTGPGGIWAPDAGSSEFAFSPGLVPDITYQQPQPRPQPYRPVQTAAPPAGASPAAAGPPPVVVPPTVSQAVSPGITFDSGWSAPSGHLFGMAGLVHARNPNLPAGSRVENGYKIYGPDVSGSFNVKRTDGSTFTISESQASRSGVKIMDPKTSKVFYQAGEFDDGVTVQEAAGLIQAITGAVGTAAGAAAGIYQDVTGTRPLSPQGQQSLAIGKFPAWVAPLGLIAVAGLGYAAWTQRKKK